MAGDYSYSKCIKLLLNAGADGTGQEGSGFETPLHTAVLSNNNRCVELLLDAGADVNAFGLSRDKFDIRSYEYNSVISLASYHGYNDIVELLLKRGANVNETNNRRTALFEASGRGHYDTMELLIKAGADVNAECYSDCEGKETALLMAVRYGFFEGVDLLIGSGADVNKIHQNGLSPLAEASCFFEGSRAPRNHHVKCLEL